MSPATASRVMVAIPKADLERARGRVSLAVHRRDGADAIRDLAQSGCGRLLFPTRDSGAPLEAVVVNTAGGMTGGDSFSVSASIGEGARAVLTTQACEKVYRSGEGPARVDAKLKVGPDAKLHWLPQETILFEGSRLRRKLEAEIDPGATFLAAEAVVLGRHAMGETLESADFHDSWRIRRGGKLVFAEETACAGGWAVARGAKAALGAEAAAFATLLLASPDVGTRLANTRALLESHGIDGGASVVDGLLVARLVAGPGLALRKAMIPLLECLSGAPLPRVWTT
jgi:urease accessory protein